MNDRLVELIRVEADSILWGKLKIASEKDLCADLDLTDRAVLRLVDKLANIFDVDISEFDIDHYYPSRNVKFWWFLVEVLKTPFSETARNKVVERELTVGMMEDAIRSGRWKL